jgi:hypothetical protein
MRPQRRHLGPAVTNDDQLTEAESWEICAYLLHDQAPAVVPATIKRPWMMVASSAFPTRCLPLLVANQAGWFILNPRRVALEWNGGPHKTDVTITYDSEDSARRWTVSHFGGGIVTWQIPILFRTPPSINLLVRGPSNYPKPGIHALEGVVETDWSIATFTMNWQMASPGLQVVFEEGEPFCMIVPQRTGELEQFTPVVRPIGANRELEQMFQQWSESRQKFIKEKKDGQFQLDYTRGQFGSKKLSTDHRTRVLLRPFLLEEPGENAGATSDL